MILMPQMMVRKPESGGFYPGLLWAFPFFLQTGFMEVVSGNVMSYVGAPLQSADGMLFPAGTPSRIILPTNVPVSGALSVVARVIGTSGNMPVLSDMITGNYVVSGCSFILRRTTTTLCVIGSKGTTANLTTPNGTWTNAAMTWGGPGTAPRYYRNSTESTYSARLESTPPMSPYPAMIGGYYSFEPIYSLIGTLAYVYVFTSELSATEIAAIHSNPEIVLP